MSYLDDLDVDPAHRDALELRYDKLKALMRKYGGSADEVLAYAETSRQRLALLEEFEADEESLTATVAAAQGEALAAAAALSEARRRLAPQVARRVEDELRGLAMPHAMFGIEVTPRGDGWRGLGPRGADEVEFLFSANPGVPPRPLRDTASGGELSRAMLAIRGIVTLGDDVETLIFDEVDTGIGGVTAAALGERLARLAERRQVLCITHLPQVAAFAERQFAIVKRERRDGRHHRDGGAAGGRRGAPRRALPHARRRARRRGGAAPRRRPAGQGGTAGLTFGRAGPSPGHSQGQTFLVGLLPDGILAVVIRGLAGHIVAPARQKRTGATSAPQNPSHVCSGSASACLRLLVGAGRVSPGGRSWAGGV